MDELDNHVRLFGIAAGRSKPSLPISTRVAKSRIDDIGNQHARALALDGERIQHEPASHTDDRPGAG